MIWSTLKALGLLLLVLFFITLAGSLAAIVVMGFKSASTEQQICQRLGGELINQSGPTECVKQVIRYTPQEKANASR